ncbi:MAG: site-2 protease family protein [Candidatus Falkowbacteria bacterium]|nr:site-2 protease family protein [Candidatus Falkowbacteria bacterium]
MIVTILLIIILIGSAILHEYAHGWMAHRLGDDTALREGRLTLNPLKHLDPVGSVIFPLFLVIIKAPFFLAWAKPVPYNPYNLRDQKYGELKVAAAGPITNFSLAIVFGLIARFLTLPVADKTQLAVSLLSGANDSALALTSGSLVASLTLVALLACLINLVLGIFNLVPIPPLDGSKVLMAFLPSRAKMFIYQIERYSIVILLLFIMSGFFGFIFNAAVWLFALLTGL